MEKPAQPQPTPNQRSFNWKKVLIAVVIGAILIGIGILIFLILQPKPTEPTPVTTKKATPLVKKDETEDWKTYVNKIIRYSIKYPDGLKVDETQAASFYSYTGEKIKVEVPISPYPPLNFIIYERTIPNVKTAKGACDVELCENLSDPLTGQQWKKEDVKINNAEGVKVFSVDSPLVVDFYLASKDGRIVRVTIDSSSKDSTDTRSKEEREKEFDLLIKILSTFKFLD